MRAVRPSQLAHHLLALAGEDLVRFVEKEIRFGRFEDIREEEIPLVVELPELFVGELERHCPASARRLVRPRHGCRSPAGADCGAMHSEPPEPDPATGRRC